MNMQRILNDPELSKELDKAYALAAPYRAKVQYKLHIFNQCDVFGTTLVAHPTHEIILLCVGDDDTWLINPILDI